MPALMPFLALRPAPQAAKAFSVPPYDVLSEKDVQELKEKNAHSMIRITRSEVDQRQELNKDVYQLAQENLAQYVKDGTLRLDATPSYTIYRETFAGRTQTGVVALVTAKDYQEGRIKRHELTLPEKQIDRTKHFLACHAQTEPVFLFAPDLTLCETWTQNPPEVDFIDEDGVRHQCWTINDVEAVQAIHAMGEAIPAFYIADGHHRTASAVTVAEENPDTHIMAVVFPEKELFLLPYHRVVHQVTEAELARMLEKLAKDFEVEAIRWDENTPQTGSYLLLSHDASYRLTYRQQAANDAMFLDAQVIQDDVLGPYFGITDPRTDPRLSFFGGTNQVEVAKKAVREAGNLVIYMPPAAIETIRRVADHNGIMPPKSTWFEPKLKSGLWIYPYEENKGYKLLVNKKGMG